MTQLSLIEDSDRPEHPLDVVERLASLRSRGSIGSAGKAGP
jgi:hypothetical protein